MFIHERGFLHNDLKSNNVVIDGSENKPVIIDFGKSCKIVKARLRKPKVNIEKSMNKFPHIAPEILCGERQSIASRTCLIIIIIIIKSLFIKHQEIKIHIFCYK